AEHVTVGKSEKERDDVEVGHYRADRAECPQGRPGSTADRHAADRDGRDRVREDGRHSPDPYADAIAHVPRELAVPLFQIATIALIVGVAVGSGGLVGIALAAMVAAIVIQGRGHRREREAPTPFAGPIDFVSRFVAEQWITFPRFVFWGGWSRNLAGSPRSRSEPS